MRNENPYFKVSGHSATAWRMSKNPKNSLFEIFMTIETTEADFADTIALLAERGYKIHSVEKDNEVYIESENGVDKVDGYQISIYVYA